MSKHNSDTSTELHLQWQRNSGLVCCEKNQLEKKISVGLTWTCISMAVPGTPDDDYPILAEVPETSFNCEGDERQVILFRTEYESL